MPSELAAKEVRAIEGFLGDPALTVACVLLIGVSIAWIVIIRVIARQLKRAELRAPVRSGTYESPRDIWAEPPGWS
jgi:hypothetical protein